MLKAICALTTLFVLVTPGAANADEAPKSFFSTLTDEALKKTPSWAQGAENPPVSARAAIQLATAVKDSLVKDSKDWKWHPWYCIHLEHKDLPTIGRKWYWRIRFEARFKDGKSTGVPYTVEVIVLMDGTTIKPHELKIEY
jgi:hypothetical protein